MKLKHIVAALTAIAIGQQATRANIHFDFDSLPSGTPANAFAPPGLSFQFGMFAPDVDGFGDPIPGADHWQTDPTAPEVLAEDPGFRGYGVAPSPRNALNGVDQTVLLQFNNPMQIDHFSTILDDSPFGNLGAQSIDFYDSLHNLVYQLPVDETIPDFVANFDGNLHDVSMIVFPNNAYFDNIDVAVPENGTAGGVVVFALALATIRFRQLARRN